MILSITTTYKPATDLGFLLHKNPSKVQSFDLSFGKAHVYYSEASNEICTAVMLLDIDPVALIRGRNKTPQSFTLGQYVNDRPYAQSSFLSTAISQVFGTAMGGRCSGKPELAQMEFPFIATLSALPSRSGEELIRRLFEPLGYKVEAEGCAADEMYPDWGDSRYYSISLEKQCRISELLTHIYVLIPVLDDDKHYWVGEDEVQKLLDKGKDWLQSHPERDLIVKRYLRHYKYLENQALAQLNFEEFPENEEQETQAQFEEEQIEKPLSLNEQRLGSVLAALKSTDAKRVLDLGCGEGKLISLLLKDKQFTDIFAMDVSHSTLEKAADKLKLDRMPAMQRKRLTLMHSSLMYKDKRLAGYDAAAVVEVIEHLDSARLAAFERVLFEFAKPGSVVLTTPNREYNVKWESLPAGAMRHRDHRFEWTREEFKNWSDSICERFGYQVRYVPIGPDDPIVGPPTQMAIFTTTSPSVEYTGNGGEV